ncbi:CsbD family protein [Aeromicrobium sp. CF3.5]|uniref:CsbD family protein n=1 Tax=Aeromicrobium sp. CF3.5 TaxID=3373078 RepID=UPI003EE50C21
MGLFDKAKNSAEKAKGHSKQAVGEHNNDKDLKAEGQKDQAKGSAKNIGENVKDAASDLKKGRS